MAARREKPHTMLRTILLLLSIAYTLQSFAQQAWRPGEVLVRLGREASIADVRNELAKRLPADVVQKEAQPLGARSRYHKLILQGAGTDDRELARIVAGVPGVEAVSLNYLVQRRAQPNDPQYGAQWHLAAMNVEPTWSITTGGSTADGKRIAVGIIDTGVQGSHPDLEDNIAVDVFGSEEHGTQVAGVVGAVGNNGTGISGVNWDVDLVSTASGNDLGDVISQFEFCLDQRTIFNQSNGSQGRMIVAVTVSWGVPGADCGFGEPLFEALGAAGILMVTSGPNDPTDIDVVDDYPATCPHDNNIVVTSYGPQNEVPFAVGDNTVHLLAPGLDILTTDLGNGYVSIDGNSFAIPAVAGAVALLYSNDCVTFAQGITSAPEATAQQVKQAILSGVSPFPGGNAITITGGKLDVHGAYQDLLAQCIPCADLTVNLSTPAGADAQYALVNGTGIAQAQGTGDAFTFCTVPGCYTGTVLDAGSLPENGTFTVLDGGVIVASGAIADGAFSFTIGTPVQGCTDPSAVNYNPAAACDDGSCCTGGAIQVIVPAADFESTGTVDALVVIGVDTVIDATYTIAPSPSTGSTSAAVVNFCTVPGCASITFSNATIPLHYESYLGMITSGGTTYIPFGTDLGFFGPLTVMAETCDGLDNDCDGEVDEDFIWYADADGDGWGALGTEQVFCVPPGGTFSQQPGDCDDTNAAIFPGASDPCIDADGLDNDCNGVVDDQDGAFWFLDEDEDGWGTDLFVVQACTAPAGYSAQFGDCDDSDPAIHPGQPEACDGLDNDCDGLLDEDFQWYTDADGDGFGAAGAEPVTSCTQPPGTAAQTGDCDDARNTVFPGAPELCDGRDNDCDGTTDEDFFWFIDADDDGFGDPASVVFSCTPVAGRITTGGDCDDTNDALTIVGAACDDGDPGTVNDRITVNCDCQGFQQGGCPPGEIEDCFGHCAPAEWVGDGFCDDGSFDWNGNFIDFTCAALGEDDGDCGSSCPNELCDGVDNDCDGLIDEDFLWYTDADGDGFGDQSSAIHSCVAIPGMINSGGDCDDGDAAVNPGAAEVCDGVDNNCDGFIDGTTTAFQSGCTNPMACNYDPGAVCDDGSCAQGSIADGSETFATDFTATDVNGDPVNLFALLAQGKTVVLDLFTTWCPPSNQMNNAGLLQNWQAHMGPDSLDLIRIISVEIEDTATATGSLAPFLATMDWPVINSGGAAIAQQFGALGVYNGFVPTLIMICPDRSARMIYGGVDELPYTGLFQYDADAALALLNERCGCRGTPCLTNVGCMEATACNYDPAATCPGPCTQAQEWFTDTDGDGYGTSSLGIACTPPADAVAIGGDCDDSDPAAHTGFTLVVLTDDVNDVGTAHYVIQQAGTVIEGDLALPAETEGIGELPVCLGDGCFSITITPNDVPLFAESYLIYSTAPEDPVMFVTADGYQSEGSTEVCDGMDNDCDGQVDEGCQVRVAARVLLEGPFDPGTGLMNDGMRALGLVPTTEPYAGLGYVHSGGGGGESTGPAVLAVTGSNAIVDWVLLELRATADPSVIVASRSALVQRDGDVVDTDGLSPVSFTLPPGEHHVAIRHRNHLGVMTANSVALTPTPVSVDLTQSSTSTYGTNACRVEGALQLLWCGDVTFNGQVKYAGGANDRDPILVRIGGALPTGTTTGYHPEDVNLNGQVRYTGANNDRDPILVTVGGTLPTAVRTQQLP